MLIEISSGETVKLLPMTLSCRRKFLVAYASFLDEWAKCLQLLPEATVAEMCDLHATFAMRLHALQEFLPRPANGQYSLVDLEVLFMPSAFSRIGLWLEVNVIAGDLLLRACLFSLESRVHRAMDTLELDVYKALEKAMESAKEANGSTE